MKKTMKLMAILLCAVTMATMSSCSKEDTYQRRIIGKWRCIHSYFDQLDDPTNINPSQYHDDNGVGQIWEFSDDGTMKITGATFSGSPEVYPYTITDECLIYGGFVSYHIHEFTNTTLIIWYKYPNNYYEYREFQKVR